MPLLDRIDEEKKSGFNQSAADKSAGVPRPCLKYSLPCHPMDRQAVLHHINSLDEAGPCDYNTDSDSDPQSSEDEDCGDGSESETSYSDHPSSENYTNLSLKGLKSVCNNAQSPRLICAATLRPINNRKRTKSGTSINAEPE